MSCIFVLSGHTFLKYIHPGAILNKKNALVLEAKLKGIQNKKNSYTRLHQYSEEGTANLKLKGSLLEQEGHLLTLM